MLIKGMDKGQEFFMIIQVMMTCHKNGVQTEVNLFLPMKMYQNLISPHLLHFTEIMGLIMTSPEIIVISQIVLKTIGECIPQMHLIEEKTDLHHILHEQCTHRHLDTKKIV
ncbi:hypothetical protein N307_06176 [Dryobates pubescens]|uniref:Uncharacterized protein n=1 Tax=Dryobates pubescens TaxID=118200 RepID=A0A093IEU6_DRYPU|nr:hypothetical protein N307_06176 [Dryobates pubescens]